MQKVMKVSGSTGLEELNTALEDGYKVINTVAIALNVAVADVHCQSKVYGTDVAYFILERQETYEV